MKTLKEAIAVAKRTEHKTVICEKQDYSNEYVLFEIKETSINREESDCYQVAQKNNSIAIAVCSGCRKQMHSNIYDDGEINYCDL